MDNFVFTQKIVKYRYELRVTIYDYDTLRIYGTRTLIFGCKNPKLGSKSSTSGVFVIYVMWKWKWKFAFISRHPTNFQICTGTFSVLSSPASLRGSHHHQLPCFSSHIMLLRGMYELNIILCSREGLSAWARHI